MRFKIDWASLIAGSKFTVFALFYFVFEGLIHGGAYFRNFTVFSHRHCADKPCPYSGVDDVRVCDSGHRNVGYSHQPVSVL